jgi:hypothetical protein
MEPSAAESTPPSPTNYKSRKNRRQMSLAAGAQPSIGTDESVPDSPIADAPTEKSEKAPMLYRDKKASKSRKDQNSQK